jgi:dihydrofolate reductase
MKARHALAATIAPMQRPSVSLIAIVDRRNGIGRDNALLLRLPEDLAHFKRTTLGAPIVMGRKTFDSIGRALPGRRNVVITRDPTWQFAGVERAGSLDEALQQLGDAPKAWIIGGAQIYAEALPFARELVLTEIDADLGADTFFPAWDRAGFRQTARESKTGPEGHRYQIATYQRIEGD